MTDTSETYIKMRVKAIPELEMGIPYDIPVAFVIPDNKNVWVDKKGDWYCKYHQGKYDAVIGCQLERQDQLQEMIGIKTSQDFLGYVFTQYFDFADDTGVDTSNPFPYTETVEQLWLAFVMKEKYNKVWNGDEWTSG